MPKQLQMWLVRPTGTHTKNKTPFRWNAYVATDALEAALTAVKWRKEQPDNLEPRQVYEVIPMKQTPGFVAKFNRNARGEATAPDDAFQALWDWDKLVEVRV